jgi:hypothetical protein
MARAHAAVSSATTKGLLVRPDRCSSCGDEGKIQAHHKNYSKPLDVEWLCVACHGRAHRGTGRNPAGRRGVRGSHLTIRVSADLKRRIVRLADADRRPWSVWIRLALEDAAAEQEYRARIEDRLFPSRRSPEEER